MGTKPVNNAPGQATPPNTMTNTNDAANVVVLDTQRNNDGEVVSAGVGDHAGGRVLDFNAGRTRRVEMVRQAYFDSCGGRGNIPVLTWEQMADKLAWHLAHIGHPSYDPQLRRDILIDYNNLKGENNG